jgi:hypothetical protein
MLVPAAPLRANEERELAARRFTGTAPRLMAGLLPEMLAVLRPKPGMTLGVVNALAWGTTSAMDAAAASAVTPLVHIVSLCLVLWPPRTGSTPSPLVEGFRPI